MCFEIALLWSLLRGGSQLAGFSCFAGDASHDATDLICLLDDQLAYAWDGQSSAVAIDVETSEFPIECGVIEDMISCDAFPGVELDGIIAVGMAGDLELTRRLAETMAGAARQRRSGSATSSY